MQCDFTCRITKWDGYFNTQTDVLVFESVTVADIRYFMANAEKTETIRARYEGHLSFL